MNQLDRKVLQRIGYNGAELAQIVETAGGDYDIDSLIRSGFVHLHRERLAETSTSRLAGDEYRQWYVLTKPGAEAIGLEPDLVDSL